MVEKCKVTATGERGLPGPSDIRFGHPGLTPCGGSLMPLWGEWNAMLWVIPLGKQDSDVLLLGD